MDKVYKEYKKQLRSREGDSNLSSFKSNSSNADDGFDPEKDDTFAPIHKTSIRPEQTLGVKDKQLLIAVERGDMATAKAILDMSEEDKTININCRDPLGRSALLIAIEYENMEMMEILLSYNVEVHDALLHAINEECVEAVEILLKYKGEEEDNFTERPYKTQRSVASQLSYQQDESSDEPVQSAAPGQSDSFTPDITPLMLAAHKDNYEIIKILLERGDTIPKPHPVQCDCKRCVEYSSDDTLCHSRSRINAYKALASPSLICLSSRDPILTAFELSWELKTLSQLEHEFKATYVKLSQQAAGFATELLDQTRGSEELEIILNHDTESAVSEMEQHGMTLSRLKLAIKYKQKEFVSHPHCQQLLASIWFDGLPGFRRQHTAYKMLMTFTIGILSPIWALLYILAPKSTFGNLMRKPFIKFIIHSASYCIFLFLLILTSQRIDLFSLSAGNKYYIITKEVRGPPPDLVEWLIVCYVGGLLWAEVKQLWDQGLEEYVHDMWNLLDFTTNTLYLATITLKAVAYIKVQEEKSLGLPSANLQRAQWNAYDPNLIAEALFAAANTFSTLKLIYIFSINPYLGPLQISLGRMIIDITKWAVVCVLVLFSFACGLNQLLWYYSLSTADKCEKSGDSQVCNSKFLKYFSDLFQIIQTLYWAMFGLVDLDAITLQEDHSFTEFAGRVMFGVYSYITVIVLLNMLIAMMNNSYQIISSQADAEWKFARSKLWLSYFEEGGTLPTPFNVIPTPKTVWYLMKGLKTLLCCCSKQVKNSRWLSLKKTIKRINDREARYQVVMRNLIKRYIMNKSRIKVDEGVTDAMKMKRKKSYMKHWQKQISIKDDPTADASACSLNSSMSTIDENELMGSLDSGSCTMIDSAENLTPDKTQTLPASKSHRTLSAARDVSKFKLKRSQSAVTFSSVVKDELMSKSPASSRFRGGILKHFGQSKSLPSSTRHPNNPVNIISEIAHSKATDKKPTGLEAACNADGSVGGQEKLTTASRRIFTLSEESME